MAGPGDPSDDPDAEVGFCTPQALEGRPRQPAPEPEPEPVHEPEPEPVPEPVQESGPASEPEKATPPVTPAPDTPATARPVPVPSDWRSSVQQAGPTVAPQASRPAAKPASTPGVTGLFGTYAMILLAVPTFGVSALIGLLSILARPAPSDDVSRSHHVFQQRTLIIAAGVAVLGVVLIVVGLGVFVLFGLAIWMIIRGAFGVLKLKTDEPIANPRSWTI